MALAQNSLSGTCHPLAASARGGSQRGSSEPPSIASSADESLSHEARAGRMERGKRHVRRRPAGEAWGECTAPPSAAPPSTQSRRLVALNASGSVSKGRSHLGSQVEATEDPVGREPTSGLTQGAKSGVYRLGQRNASQETAIQTGLETLSTVLSSLSWPMPTGLPVCFSH